MAHEHHDYRGYAGRVAGGTWRAGDDVVVLPSGRRSRVASVETADGPLDEAIPPLSAVLRLEDELDVGRGDMLADPERPPVVARELVARVCWMSERPLEPRARLAVKHTTRWSRGIVDELRSRVDLETLEHVPAPERLELNDLAEVTPTGAFVLVDEATNETVGAGMVVSASP
jgi:sulfate adenylyltransferase subunit 1 (EFTu-like GTPase family)